MARAAKKEVMWALYKQHLNILTSMRVIELVAKERFKAEREGAKKAMRLVQRALSLKDYAAFHEPLRGVLDRFAREDYREGLSQLNQLIYKNEKLQVMPLLYVEDIEYVD